jgi:hypothetical protein
MDEDRKFLTDWLIERTNVELLDDELDPGELERMTVAELFELARERGEKFRMTAEAQKREAEALRKYGRYKQAGIRGIMKGGKSST